MPITVDARGQACPQPVILTRRALAQAGEVTVIVDNLTARENVAGMARSRGCSVRVEEQADGIYLHISSRGEPGGAPDLAAPVPEAEGARVVLIAADTMGRGPEELGRILVRSFLHTLTEVEPCPQVLIFLNSGVRLVTEGSPVLDDLRVLAGRGVRVLACGTCLDYLGLKDRVAVGTVSNMYTIAEMLLGAGTVVAV